MGEGGFEPPKPKQQIYSLPHLTALELSHIRFSLRLEKNWSWWTDSTPDLLITNQLLYQLSYTSISTLE